MWRSQGVATVRPMAARLFNAALTVVLATACVPLPVQVSANAISLPHAPAPSTTIPFTPAGLALDGPPQVAALVADGYSPSEGTVCTSSLVAGGTRLVTAAHCFTSLGAAQGVHVVTETGLKGTVSDIAIHPGWDPDDIDSVDLAVATVTFPEALVAATTAALHTRVGADDPQIGTYLRRFRDRGPGQALVSVATDQGCVPGGAWTPDDSCWEPPDGGLSLCNGQSGAPLWRYGTNELIGVVSWGQSGCGADSRWGAQRIDLHLDWVEETLKAPQAA